MARGPVEAAELTVLARVGRAGGCSSSRAAPTALAAAAVATPCRIRPPYSWPSPWALRNRAAAPASAVSATAIMGRRPTWSDRDPATSRTARMAMA